MVKAMVDRLAVECRIYLYVHLAVCCVRGRRADESDWRELRRAVLFAEANGIRCA